MLFIPSIRKLDRYLNDYILYYASTCIIDNLHRLQRRRLHADFLLTLVLIPADCDTQNATSPETTFHQFIRITFHYEDSKFFQLKLPFLTAQSKVRYLLLSCNMLLLLPFCLKFGFVTDIIKT